MSDPAGNYWRTQSNRALSRRSVLRGAGIAGAGLAAAALIGCGGSKKESSGGQPAGAGAGQTMSSATASAGAANAKKGGRLQFYSSITAPNLDPTLSISYQTHHRISLVYSLLAEMQQGPKGPYDTVIQPDMAANWETSPDKLTWTFKLRPNLKWANVAPMNGREVTAEDVVYSFKRNLDPAAGNVARYSMLAAPPTAIDKSTVQFKLSFPHPGFLFNVAAEPSEIVPREAVEKEKDLKSWGAGSGPFIMTKYDAPTIASYKKNPDYYDADKVPLEGVEWPVIPDQAAATASFRSGQLDMLGAPNGQHALTPKQADEVMQTVPKAVRLNYFGPSNTAIEMNFKSPLFKDLRVRQAVNMAMDRKGHIAALAGGAGAITGTFPYARFPEYALPDEEISKLTTFNVAEAKKLLAAAGVGDGFTAKIMWQPAHQASLNVHLEMLKAIGITLDTKSEAVDYPAWVSKTYNGQFSDLAEWGYLVGSIWDYMVGLHHSKGNRNGPQSNIPELDAMIDKMLRTTNEQDQIAQVKDIERYVMTKSLYIVPLIVAQGALIQQPWVKNYNYGFGAKGGVYLSNHIRHTWLDK